jgi:hypothetical protein
MFTSFSFFHVIIAAEQTARLMRRAADVKHHSATLSAAAALRRIKSIKLIVIML